jgi:hypothetical protein
MRFGCIVRLAFGSSTPVGLTYAGGTPRVADWRFAGGLPPMTPDEWEEEFGKYKRSPEYRTVNQGMGMEDFKFIYYLEYAPPPLLHLARANWLKAERAVKSGWLVVSMSDWEAERRLGAAG